MLKTALFGLAFTILLWQPATAQNYAVFSLANFEEEFGNLDNPEGDGIRFTVGSRIDNYLSVEATYSRYEYDNYFNRIVHIETNERGTLSLEGEAESLDFAVIIQKQTHPLRPFLALGLMRFDSGDATAHLNIPSDNRRTSGDDETEPYFGFGADYFPRPNSQAGLRLEYQRAGGDIDIDFMSIGAIIRF